MDLLNAVTQQILGPAPHEEVQLFNTRPLSKHSSQTNMSVHSDEPMEQNPFHSQMRNMVLDIYNEGTTTLDVAQRSVESNASVDETTSSVGRQTGRETTKGVDVSSSRPATRPNSLSGSSLTMATFPQSESLPKSSYDVALNASVELMSDSCPVTPSSGDGSTSIATSNSFLPESLRELNSHLLASQLTDETRSSVSLGSQQAVAVQAAVASGFRRRLSFDKMEQSMDRRKARESSKRVGIVASETDFSRLSTMSSSPTQLSHKLSLMDQLTTNRHNESIDQTRSAKLVAGRRVVLPYTPPFSSQAIKWVSPSSIQTDSVKHKAREAALQLQTLREEKANLQGKLNTMQTEYSQLLEDKAALQSSLATCQAELDLSTQKNKTLCIEQTELQRAFNLIDSNKKKSPRKHQEPDVDVIRLSELEKQVMSLQDQNTKLSLQSEQYVTALVSKGNQVTELERKLKESRELVDVHQSDCSMLSNKLLFHQKKIETLDALRDASEQQIEEFRHVQKVMQEEGNRVKTEMMSCREELEQSRSQQLHLELRLAGLQEARMTEKRHMVEILEQIANDWSRHEMAFEKAQKERKGIDKALRDAQRTAKEEKQKLEEMAEQLGVQLEGTTNHLEEQVKAVLQAKSETLEIKKLLNLKEQQCHTAEQSCQEGLVIISELEKQLEQARNDMSEMRVTVDRLERDKSALLSERDANAASHSAQLAIAHQKQHNMEKLINSTTVDIRRKNEEIAQMRQQKFAVEREVQLARQREEATKLELGRLKNKLAALDADYSSKLSAKQDEISCLTNKLEAEYENINELERAINTMKVNPEIAVRKDECRRLENVAQKLEEKVSVLTDELERERHKYRELLLKLEQPQVSVGTELSRLPERSRLHKAGYIHNEKELADSEKARKRLEDEMHHQPDELSAKFERVGIQANTERGESSRHAIAIQNRHSDSVYSDSEYSWRQEQRVLQSQLEALELQNSNLQQQIQQSQSTPLVTLQQVEDLQQEISRLHLESKSQELEFDQKSQELTLAVELEKGKLAGILDAHSALKCHTAALEAALARRDQSLVHLSAKAKSALADHEDEERNVTGQISCLESQLEEYSRQLDRARKEKSQQKLQIEKLQNELATTTEQLTQMTAAAEQLDREKVQLLTTSDIIKCSLEKTESQLKNRDQEVQKLVVDLESMKSDLLIRQHEQRSMIDRVESLTWELELKTVECEQKDISGEKAAERHKLEMEEIQKQLEMIKQSNREMVVKLKETSASRHTLEEEVMKNRDQMALFQLESETTAVGEMELRTEAEIRRQEATTIHERMERLEMQNDNLRQTASNLLDQCLQARRKRSTKHSLLSDALTSGVPDQEVDDTVMTGSARSVTTNLQLCLDLLRNDMDRLQREMEGRGVVSTSLDGSERVSDQE